MIMMRWLGVGVGVALAACGGGSDNGGDASVAGAYTLRLSGAGYVDDPPSPRSIFAAVRDRADDALVRWEAVEIPVGDDSFAVEWPGVLEPGHAYALGFAWASDFSCGGLTPVWRVEIPAVTDDVDLVHDRDVDFDRGACDLLRVPVPLAAGTYSAASLNGDAETGMTFVVSPTGRVFKRASVVGCALGDCGDYTAYEASACDNEAFYRPDRRTFPIYDSGNESYARAIATIDEAAGTIGLDGTMGANTPGGAICCTVPFSSTATRRSDDTWTCP